MKSYLLALLSFIIIFSGCSAKSSTSNSESSSTALATQVVVEDSIIAAYLEVKNALIETDFTKTKANSIDLEKALGDKFKELKETASFMSRSENIENQRKYFSLLSEDLYNILKDQNTSSVTLYKQYCPMAFHNTGAFWLSSEEAILNPYFGDRMLRCGRIEDTIVAVN